MKPLLAAACCVAMTWAASAQADLLRAETVIEGEGTAAVSSRDEFAGLERQIITRRVRETEDRGIDVVALEDEGEDGFGFLSVDKGTELGREILRLCPDGSLCRLDTIITNGTMTRIYTIRNVQ